MSDSMAILLAAKITSTKAYDVLTYTKWKDGIDVDYPTVELDKIIEAATNAKIEQLEADMKHLTPKVCGLDAVDGCPHDDCSSCVPKLNSKVKQLETENKIVKIKLKAADLLLEYIRENYLPLTQSIGINDE